MKIAITSAGDTPDSPVDPHFGRAERFVLFDTETGEYSAVGNVAARNAPHGAGIQAADTASRVGADCVITGQCGPKAFRALQASGIQVVVGAEGSVADVIMKFKAGELPMANGPNAQ